MYAMSASIGYSTTLLPKNCTTHSTTRHAPPACSPNQAKHAATLCRCPRATEGHRVPPVRVGAHGSTAKRHSARTCGLTGGAAPFQSTFRCIDLTLSIGSDLRS
jgi:hypothetical protein